MSERFTFDYFQDEFKRFWDCCGDATMTAEQIMRGFSGLCYVAVNAEGDDKRIGQLLQTAGINLEYRLPYFLMKEAKNND